MIKRTTLGLILILISVAACSQQSAGNTTVSGAVSAIQNYLNVQITGDADKLVSLACKDYESKARTAGDSFKSRNPKLDGVVCKETGTDSGVTLVHCDGQIVTNYNGENTPYDLSARTFKVIQEDGQWKMCGYAANK